MKRLSLSHLILSALIAGSISVILTSPASASQAARDRGPSPTPAAFAACVNHKLGDRVIVKTAAGKSLNGTCRKYKDKLAARTHIRHKKDKSWWKSLTSWI
ncbi:MULTISPECIES: hypothetical protein [Pseudomonas syringae group]|uniref:hypothetical protein n=1 Tax=Pseudomonas syringae group TaxID=136849 RepID=UPI000E321CA7|nr:MULTISPECIES: hypothetical protein [Pseudomonas syringae group]